MQQDIKRLLLHVLFVGKRLHSASFGEGNGTPLQYSCLDNPMEGGAWQATVHGVAKSRTRQSNFTSLPRSKRLLISWLQSPSKVILEPKKIKSDTVSPSICHEVMGLDAMIFIFCMLSFRPTFFTLHFHFHQEAFQFLFTFCHKGGVIRISEVIDISPSNLDSSLCFFQSSISHDVLYIEVK